MVFVVSSTIILVQFLLSTISLSTEAHSWIDCIDTDRAKLYDQSSSYIFGGAGGNGYCEGYGAGYPGRGDLAIGPGYTYKMLRNEVEAGAPVCQPVDPNTYSDWRKRISLKPGQTAFFSYLPNGHIVKDKKGVGTQHGVYWTGQPGTSLASTHDMKPEHLINGHTNDYDDGNCGETYDYNGKPSGRAGDGKPCIGSFSVPAGTAPGIYKMVWYWTFWLDNQDAYKDQNMAKGYFGAAYSTCFEIEVKSDGSNVNPTTVGPKAAAPDPASAPAGGPKPASGSTPAKGTVIGFPQKATLGMEMDDTEQDDDVVVPGTGATATEKQTNSPIGSSDTSDASDAYYADEGSDDDGASNAKFQSVNESSASMDRFSSMGSELWDIDEVGQIDEMASTDEDDAGSESDLDTSSSTSSMESAATSIQSVKQFAIIGFALLIGVTLL
ncbi:uncharacterized protein PHALS_14073 [Plasmopara halstedii]|uniref:DUF7492 domain-containing protein n=1 Tax=Plasmopara halstedii TaxID=4781 RepID=A0A0P1AQV6_PLAHL|nr:uncharacterized protein PHALS_14073 [Plasmopara halstedii]CEG43781.1 hypothetical protein PHALS_14073 [Plasmopara halstedii]|eukprot:XP_024580150.1 hypothetical protein PHALS_14073 [Plasmopara halstedii]